MNNAFGQPQTVLLLGGNSDIGVAIVREMLPHANVVTRQPVPASQRAPRAPRA